MKTVRIQYFAKLKEERGEASEEWRTDCPNVKALYSELSAKYGFSLTVDTVRAAINGDYCSWDASLNDQDEVVFIPPVAGG